MNQKEFYLADEFVDFTNTTRSFILCAILTTDPEEVWVTDVAIGLSVTKKGDKFDYRLGSIIAKGKADKKPIVSVLANSKILNAYTIQALLESQAEHFKRFPEQYIANYEKDKQKFFREKQ